MNSWRIIKDKESFDIAMHRLLELADSDLLEDSAELEEFELLSLLIGHYEEQNFAISKPTPIEAIKFRMDQMGLTQADMRQYLGSASKVSEVLSGKRKLSLSMIRRLHDDLGIPADILIQDSSSIEWSSMTYSAETLAIAFNDSRKALSSNAGFEDVSQASSTFMIKAKKISSDVSSKIQLAPLHEADFADCH